jgi:hypothetical protein
MKFWTRVVILAGPLALAMLAAVPRAAAADGARTETKESAGNDAPRGGINHAGLWEWTGPARRSPTIKYINPEVPSIELPA